MVYNYKLLDLVSVIYTCRYVIEALESICYDAHSEKGLAELRNSWPSNVKTEAVNLLNSITDFQFIVNFCIVYSLLSPLEGITTKLQGRCNDVCRAFSLVSNTMFMMLYYILIQFKATMLFYIEALNSY